MDKRVSRRTYNNKDIESSKITSIIEMINVRNCGSYYNIIINGKSYKIRVFWKNDSFRGCVTWIFNLLDRWNL